MGIWFNVEEQALPWQDGYHAFRLDDHSRVPPYSHHSQYASLQEWRNGFEYAKREAAANQQAIATLIGAVQNG